MSIIGLGPHGERAAPPERVALLPGDIEQLAKKNLRIAVVMHTLESDWARQLAQGIVGTCGQCGIIVVDVVDCQFSTKKQIEALDHLHQQPLDAIISLPIGNVAVADAHRRVAQSGKRLVLIDNVPTGMLPGKDYSALVSADNFGLGTIAAKLMSPNLPKDSQIVLLGYNSDFFVANQREIAFSRWFQIERPDVQLHAHRFSNVHDTKTTCEALLSHHDSIAGFFVVWDTPALGVMQAVQQFHKQIPIVTVDLGREVTLSLASGGPIVGIASQLPYQQGETVARTTAHSLLERNCPEWVALPGIPVTIDNVIESYQLVWQAQAPKDVIKILGHISNKD